MLQQNGRRCSIALSADVISSDALIVPQVARKASRCPRCAQPQSEIPPSEGGERALLNGICSLRTGAGRRRMLRGPAFSPVPILTLPNRHRPTNGRVGRRGEAGGMARAAECTQGAQVATGELAQGVERHHLGKRRHGADGVETDDAAHRNLEPLSFRPSRTVLVEISRHPIEVERGRERRGGTVQPLLEQGAPRVDPPLVESIQRNSTAACVEGVTKRRECEICGIGVIGRDDADS
jgi:hypothetical protein